MTNAERCAERWRTMPQSRRDAYNAVKRQRRQLLKEKHLRNGVSLDGEKVCQSCKQRLPKTAFFFNRTKTDGLSNGCKGCAISDVARRRLGREEYKALARSQAKRARDNLSDTYVRNLLGPAGRAHQLEELVPAKRAQLIVKRQLKEGAGR